jgi:predicted DNA-binding protein with PD1-like motif
VQSRLVAGESGRQTFVLVFETGDEAMEGLRAFAREHGLSAAQLAGIGASTAGSRSGRCSSRLRSSGS